MVRDTGYGTRGWLTVAVTWNRSDDQVLADLHRVADAVAEAFAGLGDGGWGPSGEVGRPDQYASDVVADRVVHLVLDPLGYGVLSEESGLTPGPGPTVVVDPLDGSTNASRRLPWFATSLCVVDVEGPWVAVVADQAGGARYEAVRGGGARRDGVTLRRDDSPVLADAVVACNGLAPEHGGWAQFRALGAAALELCAVADGGLDGFVECVDDSLAVWDYLGAALVCAEAGVDVVDVHGRNLCVLDVATRRTPVAGVGTVTEDLVAFRLGW